MYISWINHAQKNTDIDHSLSLHPFYIDSFAAAYGLSPDSIILPEQTQISIDWILDPLKQTITSGVTEPDYFFDVRTTEDYSSPAPEYLLLHHLHCKHTSPLSIKGMGALALIQAFQISELYLTGDKTALFCVAEEYNQYDKDAPEGYVASFLVSNLKGEMQIEYFDFISSEEELVKFLQKHNIDHIYTEPGVLDKLPGAVRLDHFLTRIFQKLSELNQTGKSFGAACVSEYEGRFGCCIIRKDPD